MVIEASPLIATLHCGNCLDKPIVFCFMFHSRLVPDIVILFYLLLTGGIDIDTVYIMINRSEVDRGILYSVQAGLARTYGTLIQRRLV